MKLLIAGGGTGGHLYPGVAVAEELLGRKAGHEVLFAGSALGIEARMLPRLGLPFKPVRCGAVVGRGAAAKARALWRTALGIADGLGLIGTYRPDAVLGVGGYASFPVAAAAKLKGVFSAIQEQNATPGLANKVLSGMVNRVYAGDEAAAASFPPAKTFITGTPIRHAFDAAFPYEPPVPGKPARVLVLGGSQGATSLNRIVPEALRLVKLPLEIRHQAGRDKEDAVREAYRGREGVSVEAFIEDMAGAYRRAQIVIARSGALTLAELAGAGRPAILVPFPHAAGNHQEANARAAEGRHTAVCVTERELTAEGLAALVGDWIENPQMPISMAEAAGQSARRDAAKLIVDDLLTRAGKGS